MKKTVVLFLFAAASSILLLSTKEKPVRIFLAGDSTMADKPLNSCPERGWGMVLPSFFNDNVVIENHARNGRSTRTFISEGRWDYLLSRVGAGDYVVIQFGHNDQSKEKTDRYTSPEDYKKNLEKFVADVRAKSAIPILCTPVVRRKFDEKGNFVDQHGIYPNLVRQVAREQNVYLIDMHHTSMDLVIEKGVEGSKELFLHVDAGECPKFPDGKEDNTHFRDAGAMAMAWLFVEGFISMYENTLRSLPPSIFPLLKNWKSLSEVQLQYTTPVPNLDKLKNTINHNLDEGNTRKSN
ncbi:MAG: rhamnogalacturonan acetylesterase [Prevotellaceae bacterium]|jgi:lysophospholipase L1-like esterase|nr:rhamnogalacturonan acetylesterase [Prevotellaceae bacterium]